MRGNYYDYSHLPEPMRIWREKQKQRKVEMKEKKKTKLTVH